MPNELNTPNHRWYQKRYNIPLAREDYSRQYIYASGISKIDAWIDLLAGRDYSVLGFEPLYVADFDDENYRVQGASTPVFSDALTHSASSNATMVDSDGLLKWRPHNLLTYSEQFDQWNTGGSTTVTANQIVAPDGLVTADEVSAPSGTAFKNISESITPTGVNTYRVYAKTGSHRYIQLLFGGSAPAATAFANFDLVDGVVGSVGGGTSSITSAGNGWYLCSFTGDFTNGNGAFVSFIDTPTATRAASSASTGNFYIWGAHIYRSDLGGMVNNPDRGDSYVPTTSAASYLPRRGHHVYNGSAWVNEGLLHESEARTNLLTYSEDLSNAAWAKVNSIVVTADQLEAPDGLVTADEVNIQNGQSLYQAITVSPSTVYTASWYIKAGTATSWIYAFYDETAASFVNRVEYDITSGQDFGNGWYRFSVSVTTPAGCTSLRFYPLRSALSSGDTPASYGTSYLWGVQIEEGPTPSSYIPNAGATAGARREVETLTIPAANLPWPTPEVIGPELVTNGTFDTDTTGWTAGSAIISVSSGQLTIDRNNASLYDCAYQAITTEVGKVYRLTIDVIDDGVGNLHKILVTSALSSGNLVNEDVITGSYEVVFVATTTTSYVHLVPAGSFTNITVVDNISVREINPLAVSIQMDGRVTYADEDTAPTASFLNWNAGGGVYINNRLDTNITNTGRVRFSQQTGGIFDNVSADVLSPTVLSSFNIASRHGSTFIAGAVDGVDIGDDLTPVALPDLETADLILGDTYNGTIRTFRIWADDIGDTGLVEATEPSLVPSLSLTFDGTESSFIVEDWSE